MASFDFQSHKNDIERKAQAARRDMASRLYREDGITHRYGPTDHQEILNHILQPLQQAVADAIAIGQKAQDEARKLKAQTHGDPLSGLTTEELQRLNLAKDLAAAEISALLPEQLSQRLIAVAAGDDRVSQMLHIIYAKPLVQASGDSRLHAQLAAIDEIAFGAQRAKAAKAAEEANALDKAAAELSFFASSTLGEVDGSNAASLEQRRAEYASYF